ncbi:hypothetical protein ADUPG1_013119 [Aduncisulcus paluster]|uniref:EF-hand domain-containing protein n=1 Tax=Aduncisulcus paluster TaxID=2918883 RepID=A0ABQ5K608_9EUKA|nr:hypothetical protein ADUPG1_013119 [Aduncisulcus paluster]
MPIPEGLLRAGFMSEIEALFDEVDTEKKGIVDLSLDSQSRTLQAALDLDDDDYALLMSWITYFDKNEDGVFDKNELAELIAVFSFLSELQSTPRTNYKKIDVICDWLFQLIDCDKSGTIEFKEIKFLLSTLHKLTGKLELDFFDEIDTDGSGTIEFDEFKELIKGVFLPK